MIAWLLSFLDGGKLAIAVAAALAAAIFVWKITAGIKQSGVDEQKARESVAREHDLEQIKRAADAGEHVDPDGVSVDRYNRDRR